jgi:hypothetical protein
MAKEQNFDEPAPDYFLKQNSELIRLSNLIMMERFSKEQSKDFYLGMIAAERVILSFMRKCHGEDFKASIIEFGLCAAFIANQKTNNSNNERAIKAKEYIDSCETFYAEGPVFSESGCYYKDVIAAIEIASGIK